MVVTGYLARTPVTSARFRHLYYRRRNLFTPNGDCPTSLHPPRDKRPRAVTLAPITHPDRRRSDMARRASRSISRVFNFSRLS